MESGWLEGRLPDLIDADRGRPVAELVGRVLIE